MLLTIGKMSMKAFIMYLLYNAWEKKNWNNVVSTLKIVMSNELAGTLCSVSIGTETHQTGVTKCNPHHGHYSDVITSAITSQIISLASVYSTGYSGTDQRKHQSSASLAFVRGIHRWPVNSAQRANNAEIVFHLMTSSWVQSVCDNIDRTRSFCFCYTC